MKKTVTLNVGREIEMLGLPVPTVEGEDGKPRPMTVGDLMLRRIPGAASRDNDHATRLWDIGSEMDKAGATFTMTEVDSELLRKAICKGEIETWARIALIRVFKEAKRE